MFRWICGCVLTLYEQHITDLVHVFLNKNMLSCWNYDAKKVCACVVALSSAKRLTGSCSVNECATNNGGCSQLCVDTYNSYFCACNVGYTLASGISATCPGKIELHFLTLTLTSEYFIFKFVHIDLQWQISSPTLKIKSRSMEGGRGL